MAITQHLRETLAHSRAVREDWVEQEREAANVRSADAARRVSLKQNEIDSASTALLALQLESGLSMLNTSNNENNATQDNLNNASAKRKALELKVKSQQTQNDELETRLKEQQKKLEGTKVKMFACFSFCPRKHTTFSNESRLTWNIHRVNCSAQASKGPGFLGPAAVRLGHCIEVDKDRQFDAWNSQLQTPCS